MEPKTLLRSDYLDIIFDNRNKNYGGYELRKNYNRRLKKAGMFVGLALSALFTFAFISSRERGEPKDISYRKVDTLTFIAQPPKQVIEPPKRLITPPPAKSIVYNVPKITPDDLDTTLVMREVKKLGDARPGKCNVDTGSNYLGPSGPIGKMTVGKDIVTQPPSAPLVVAEQMPQYIGDLNSYLAKNIQYPEAARNGGVEGRVGVEFVVNEDGSISNVKVIHSIGAGCDEEAMRVIRSMPKWKPGRNNGVPVKVMFTQPISFKLE